MSDLKERMAKLSPEKRALLQAMLMKDKHPGAGAETTIPRRRDPGPAPLSFGQSRLWFLDRMVPGNAFFNLPLCLRMEGRLDAVALEKALNAIIARHDALRTTFQKTDEGPVQVVADAFRFRLETADLTGLTEGAQEETIRRAFETLVKGPFDLSRLPLIRVRLLRLAESVHVLLLVQHHIVSDGWSLGVFVRELRHFYGAFATGGPAELPPLPIQYPDFALWQRERLSGDALSPQLEYWKSRLSGAPQAISLPFDRPRPSRQSFRGGSRDFRIDAGGTAALNRLSRHNDVTLFMTLFAAFSVLLYRYSGQADFLVGTPVANRRFPETEPLIGFFLNTLVLRAEPKAVPTFTAFLKQVKGGVLEAFSHPDLPLERLVDALQPERRLDRHPLFQVMFVLQNAPLEALTLPGLAIRPVEQERFTSQLDLTLSMAERNGELHGTFEYSTDLFEEVTIRRMAANFSALAAAIADDPDRSPADLPVVCEPERRRILDEFNATAAPYPRQHTIAQRFEAQVRKTPDRTAVIFEDRSLTYGELNRAANRIAHGLRAAVSPGPDDRVGVMMNRSEGLIVALLGVLKAGGAYLPIDPTYPSERIGYLAADSRCRALITESALLDRLPDLGGDTDIRVYEGIDHPATDDPPPVNGAENLAYVIYTSGSTGRPKGVMLEHHGFINMAQDMIRKLGIDETDRVLQFASASFDGSMFEIFTALFAGAAVVCLPGDTARDPEALIESIRRQGVTVAALPPAYLKVIGFERLRCLKTLITAGEQAFSDAGRFVDAGHRYWNLYGPTEASVTATAYEIGAGHPSSETIPIGTPVANLRILILDPEGVGLQPVGAVGEICIQGEGLARGYLHRPELTAEKFILSPLYGGERIYRTGDLGRWRPDGQVAFLGRRDDQVKIRGFRIEPAEIERALERLPGVREAAVVPVETPGAGQALAAYVAATEAIDADRLRHRLKAVLPDHMIPALFVRMDRLPLTPNRKIDKKALPDPDSSAMASAPDYSPPQTPAETAVAEAMGALLGRERVGRRDHYFDLGGDSIRAVQVVSHLGRLGWKTTVKDLFEHPTPEGLAPRLVPAEAAADREDAHGTAPLTPVQHWFFQEVTTSPHHFNQAYVLRGRPRFDEAALSSGLSALWDRHDTLHLRFVRQNGDIGQEYAAPPPPLHFETADWRGRADGESRFREFGERLQGSLDLERGPLMKTALCRFDREDRLLMVVHHLVVDQFSFRILFEELDAAYEQAGNGSTIALPPRTADFGEWGRALLSLSRDETISAQRAYWRETACLPRLNLPADSPSGPDLNRDGEMLVEGVTEEATADLIGVAPAGRVEALLLSALATALSGRTAEREGVILVAGHGRESDRVGVDVSRTVGWFSTMYPLRLRVPGPADAEARVGEIRRRLDAVPDRGFGYAVLRYLYKDPLLGQSPWPPIVFNYIGQLGDDAGHRNFTVSFDAPGAIRHPLQERPHGIELNALILDGRLILSVIFGAGRYRKESMTAFLTDLRDALVRLAKELRGKKDAR